MHGVCCAHWVIGTLQSHHTGQKTRKCASFLCNHACITGSRLRACLFTCHVRGVYKRLPLASETCTTLIHLERSCVCTGIMCEGSKNGSNLKQRRQQHALPHVTFDSRTHS